MLRMQQQGGSFGTCLCLVWASTIDVCEACWNPRVSKAAQIVMSAGVVTLLASLTECTDRQ